jgi:hypothetical protein
LNVTVPVGVPDGADTVAVNVTLCPTRLGFTDEASATDVVCKMTEFVALPDTVVALLALAVAVLVTEPAGVPTAVCATMAKLYVAGAAEAIEQVTVPPEPAAGVVQVQAPPGPVTPALTKPNPAGNGSDSDALVAVPVPTVSEIE